MRYDLDAASDPSSLMPVAKLLNMLLRDALLHRHKELAFHVIGSLGAVTITSQDGASWLLLENLPKPALLAVVDRLQGLAAPSAPPEPERWELAIQTAGMNAALDIQSLPAAEGPGVRIFFRYDV